MALRIKSDPVAFGERWERYDDDVDIKIAGLDTEAYQIALERARRLIVRSDAGQSLADIRTAPTDRREHDIQCALIARHIILDWKGDVTDADGNPLSYSPENAQALLASDANFLVWVISTAAKVTADSEAEITDAVGKPSPASAGRGSGQAGAKSKG